MKPSRNISFILFLGSSCCKHPSFQLEPPSAVSWNTKLVFVSVFIFAYSANPHVFFISPPSLFYKLQVPYKNWLKGESCLSRLPVWEEKRETGIVYLCPCCFVCAQWNLCLRFWERLSAVIKKPHSCSSNVGTNGSQRSEFRDLVVIQILLPWCTASFPLTIWNGHSHRGCENNLGVWNDPVRSLWRCSWRDNHPSWRCEPPRNWARGWRSDRTTPSGQPKVVNTLSTVSTLPINYTHYFVALNWINVFIPCPSYLVGWPKRCLYLCVYISEAREFACLQSYNSAFLQNCAHSVWADSWVTPVLMCRSSKNVNRASSLATRL